MRRLIPMLGVLLLGATCFAANPAKVLVVPFEPIGAADKSWVAKALQQNLIAELSRVNSIQPVTAQQPTTDAATALKAGADAGAQYVIFGSYQFVETDLRITGQVLDVTTGQPLTGLKATGSQRDLFGLEDQIAQQARRALPQPVAENQPEMLKKAQAQPAAAAQPVDVRVVPFDANQRARDLEDQIDQAIDRMRDAMDRADNDNVWNYRPIRYTMFPYGYGYGYGYGIGYPFYTTGWGYGTQTNVAIIGGYRGKHWNVNWRTGGGNSQGRGR